MTSGNLNRLEISYEQLRSLVVQALRKLPSGQLGQLSDSVARVAVEQKAIRDPYDGIGGTYSSHDYHLNRGDYLRVQDIFWDLLIEGVVRPGSDSSNEKLPWFRVTEYGQKVLKDGYHTPYDPDGYISRLQSRIAGIDPAILTYLNESLHTFRIGCLLSSTITLGCASEKALLLLIAAYADALQPSKQTSFLKDTTDRPIKRQYDEFRKRLDSHLKNVIAPEHKEDLEGLINGAFTLIRNLRNDAGHPIGTLIEREQAYANLQLFPGYLQKIYDVIGWLAANKGLL